MRNGGKVAGVVAEMRVSGGDGIAGSLISGAIGRATAYVMAGKRLSSYDAATFGVYGGVMSERLRCRGLVRHGYCSASWSSRRCVRALIEDAIEKTGLMRGEWNYKYSSTLYFCFFYFLLHSPLSSYCTEQR